MKTNEKILPFENLLSAYITNDHSQSMDVTIEQESGYIFSVPVTVSLSDHKVDRLLASLQKSLSKETLGALVTTSLGKAQTSPEEIYKLTGLTTSVLDAIKDDLAFTNSIPVKSLVKLLKYLSIPLAEVKKAIDQTFEKLISENKMFLAMPVSAQPYFRKGVKRGDLGTELLHLKADESYLYQNKEALEKYTNRLSELYNEMN
ncbi:hypothetical protein [Mucilaginibacter flavidus]|jgi:F0F1-type ATP synthase delta subunit|uniref:hypothetical protein n=1 Tax=Mucilaginibacter flavidus TaxID=2949309 RepID=UPI002092BA4C|nr:hypothetical protein [Mucilaginibacter flavidus]MCO5950526.1 hypothetical protein [Mucilaginibacter flavidus]